MFLGDIPVLGLLFKSTRWYSGSSNEPNRQDLLIFLTVKLLDEDPGQAQTVAAAPAEPSAR